MCLFFITFIVMCVIVWLLLLFLSKKNCIFEIKHNMIEQWKIIEDYPDYMVSNFGRVKSLNYRNTGKEKIMTPNKLNNGKGYLRIELSKNCITKKFLVHRLVATAFIPNPENKPQIDHINTDRTDNRVENLRWVTNKENCNNPISKKHYSNGNKGKTSKKIVQFTLDEKFIKQWDSINEIKNELGFNNISACCMGKRNKSGNFKWYFMDKWLYNYASEWWDKEMEKVG